MVQAQGYTTNKQTIPGSSTGLSGPQTVCPQWYPWISNKADCVNCKTLAYMDAEGPSQKFKRSPNSDLKK